MIKILLIEDDNAIEKIRPMIMPNKDIEIVREINYAFNAKDYLANNATDMVIINISTLRLSDKYPFERLLTHFVNLPILLLKSKSENLVSAHLYKAGSYCLINEIIMPDGLIAVIKEFKKND